ncbi:ATP-binding protein [Bengtsoniella intestinalis]|uniref:ATP-binding protein n=1 Tax=Bengtsoniella intestinalis TaxID=3073143 RepID=UPI00391F3800
MKTYSFGAVLQILKEHSTGNQEEILCAILGVDNNSELSGEAGEKTQVTKEFASRLFNRKQDLGKALKLELLNLTGRECQNRSKKLGKLIDVGETSQVIEKLRGLVYEQVVRGIIYKKEADLICGSDYSTDDYNYDMKKEEAVLWRLIVESVSRNNIERKDIEKSVQSYFGRRLVPITTATRLVGRNDMLNQITQSLKEKDCIVLSGLPGIGKSKLAEAYVENVWTKGNVLWLRYEGSIRLTLLQAKCITVANEATEDEKFAHAMQLLNALGKDLLVVLDNADGLDRADKDFEDFCQCGCRKLITSRDEWLRERFLNIVVTELSEDELLEVFNNSRHRITRTSDIGVKAIKNPEKIRKLVKLVHYNTLVVELMGKWVRVTGERVEKLLNDLQKRQSAVPGDPQAIFLGQTETSIKEHLSWLFEKYKFGIEEKRMIQMFSMLSSYGVLKRSVRTWGDMANNKLIGVNKLIDKGLLIEVDESVFMAPLLRDIFLEKYQPASGGFDQELKGVLEEVEQPRGLWAQNLMSIAVRMRQWEVLNAGVFLRKAFMATMDYGLVTYARAICKCYAELPDEMDPNIKEIHQTYMYGMLFWKDGKDPVDIGQGQLLLESAREQCQGQLLLESAREQRQGEGSCLAKQSMLWVQCNLALAQMCWKTDEEYATALLEDAMMGLGDMCERHPHLAEEAICSMSKYSELYSRYHNIVALLEKVWDIIRMGWNARKVNWLKLGLAYANIGLSVPGYKQEKALKYIKQALTYGDEHHLQESFEYLEVKKLEAQLTVGISAV